MLQPQSSLAVFAMSGLVLCFLNFPLHKKMEGSTVDPWCGCCFGRIGSALLWIHYRAD